MKYYLKLDSCQCRRWAWQICHWTTIHRLIWTVSEPEIFKRQTILTCTGARPERSPPDPSRIHPRFHRCRQQRRRHYGEQRFGTLRPPTSSQGAASPAAAWGMASAPGRPTTSCWGSASAPCPRRHRRRSDPRSDLREIARFWGRIRRSSEGGGLGKAV
jgi:hypothetical protein